MTIGEKDFLVRLHEVLGSGDVRSWRDDCVIRDLGGQALAYSLDRPERIRHSGDEEADLRHFGRWSAALVASDVIACGLPPAGIAFDVGRSAFGTEAFLEWAGGVQEICDRYGMRYEGGNIGVGDEICGMAYGLGEIRRIIRRTGARDGDAILVTAALGTGWARRLWQEDGDGPFPHPELATYQDQPAINLDAFREVWDLGAIHSGMDLTDGVLEFGYEISTQDGLGVKFEAPADLPASVCAVAEGLDLPPAALLFEPGYDTPYAHGWCVPVSALPEIEAVLDRHRVPHLQVGRVYRDRRGVSLVAAAGREVEAPRYWDDLYLNRGSVARWRERILPLFDHSGQ